MSDLAWQDPTNWSTETTDGMFYAERHITANVWTLFKQRGRGKGKVGEFSTKSDAQAAVAAKETPDE